MSDKEKSEWDDREVGALWVNQKSDGTKYLTGTLNGEKVIVFKNKYKEENAKAPDFRVYKQKPQGDVSVESKVKEEVEPDLI
tara:strand:- start:2994 stop:3239 length:246 start_codon:yes stop_codon:yes gene_type:complete